MHRFSLPLLLVVIVCLLASSNLALAQDLEHFEYHRTLFPMSILVQALTLDDESLVELDEVGIFTEDGMCVGASVVTDPEDDLGMAAWPDSDPFDEEQDGFFDDEDMYFRIWEREVDREWDAEPFDVVRGEPIFATDGWLVCSIRGAREHAPDIEVSANYHDFGNTPEGEPVDWTLTISNTGDENLEIQEIATEAPFRTDFGEEAVVLEPDSEPLEVVVTFAPEEEGVFAGSLTIVSNDPDENEAELVIELDGRYQVPAPRIYVPAAEAGHPFGSITVNRVSEWGCRIYNIGEETLTIDEIVIEGDQVFSTSFEENIEIEASENEIVVVYFAPDQAEDFSADMMIHSDDPDVEWVGVHLTGSGRAEGDAQLEINDLGQHFFGDINVNESATWRMVLSNVGGGDLTIHRIESDNDAFTVDFPPNDVRLRPDDFVNVNVTFTPEATELYEGTLVIDSDDPAEEPMNTCYLSGTGVENNSRHFRYSETSLNHSLLVEEAMLGDAALGEGSEIGVFTPLGMCAGAGVVPENGRTGFAAWADDDPDNMIINGFFNDEEFTFMIWDMDADIEAIAVAEFLEGPEVFARGARSRLNLTADIPAPEPDIWVNSYIYHFGQADYDDENEYHTKVWQYMTIRNVGPGDLVIQSIEPDLAVFTTDFDGETVLEQNQQIDISVYFTPTAEQDYFGRITITSNDPIDPIVFVDVDGEGVSEVQEPQFSAEANYFFGEKRIDPENPYTYPLVITNTGGGDLRITNVVSQGSQAFFVNFRNEIVIESMASAELMVSFDPDRAATEYNAAFSISWNAPNDDDTPFIFSVRGYGSDSEDHFLHHQTNYIHTLHIERAYQVTLREDEANLATGDEIAIFTPEGLCAGHSIVGDANWGQSLTLLAYGDDPNNAFKDGFYGNDAPSFKAWDWTVGAEIDLMVDMDANFQGDQTFRVNGATTLTLYGVQEVGEPQVWAVGNRQVEVNDEMVNYLWFGPVRSNTEATLTLTIQNIGTADLTVTGISTTDENIFQAALEEEVVLNAWEDQEEPESIQIEVTYTPTAGLSYEEEIIIETDDPDQPEYHVPVAGTGSVFQGHYDFYVAGANHSFLAREIDLGGAGPGVYDEVALFTADGMCAGAFRITDPAGGAGPAAMGDDGETDFSIEGFSNLQDIVVRYYDYSQNHEYILDPDENIEVVQGGLRYFGGAFTVMNISIPDVFSILPDPSVTSGDEGDVIEVDFELINAPGGIDLGDLEFIGVANFEDVVPGGNVALNDGHFEWETDNTSACELDNQNRPIPWRFVFGIHEGDINEEVTVLITINNVIIQPDWTHAFCTFVENRDPQWEIEIDEDSDYTLQRLVQDEENDGMFESPEGLPMRFIADVAANLSHGVTTIDDIQYWRVRPAAANWFGESIVTITAQYEQQQNMQRELHVVEPDMGPVRDGSVRTLHSVRNGFDLPTPGRDDNVARFRVIVNNLNDAPVITQPANAAEHNVAVNENNELVVNFACTDIANEENEHTWEMTNQGGLPDPVDDNWNFEQMNDLTARFTWTPDYDMAGNYDPVFTVSDGFDPDQITVHIRVGDVNRAPEITADIPDAEVDEDCAETVVVNDLNDYFGDPDGNDLSFRITQINPANMVTAVIFENVRVRVTPIANYNGNVAITVVARDVPGALDSQPQTFTLTVNPINDPPMDFAMLTPVNNTVIDDDVENITFSWEASRQNQWEHDGFHYVLAVTTTDSIDNPRLIPTDQTSLTFSVQEVLTQLGIEEEHEYGTPTWIVEGRLLWWVTAVDDNDAATPSISGRWFIDVRLDVANGGAIPDEYYLSNVYPNPFNEVTNVRFGVKAAGNVQISIWDMHGRQVAVVASGHFEAGNYNASWSAEGLTSGVYLIRMDSRDFHSMRKAILLR